MAGFAFGLGAVDAFGDDDDFGMFEQAPAALEGDVVPVEAVAGEFDEFAGVPGVGVLVLEAAGGVEDAGGGGGGDGSGGVGMGGNIRGRGVSEERQVGGRSEVERGGFDGVEGGLGMGQLRRVEEHFVFAAENEGGFAVEEEAEGGGEGDQRGVRAGLIGDGDDGAGAR